MDRNDFVKIKKQLEELYNKNNIIHVDIFTKRKPIRNAISQIEGIYDRFMCVTSLVNTYKEEFTISYLDILTKRIVIKEL